MGLDRKLQYHSMTGCCICGTKTSSSRFTSSARFESLFAPCFGIAYNDQRSGDICNACVLIVKRFRNSPRDSCKNWAHIIGSKVGPGHRSIRRQKTMRHEARSSMRPKLSRPKPPSQSVGKTSSRGRRTPSPMRLRHPKRFTVKPDSSKEKKPTATTKFRAVTVGCGRRAKVFRRRPTRRLRSFATSSQLIDTDFWKRVMVCCGAVYKSESHDLILIDVAKFKPCHRRHHDTLAHFTVAARNAEVIDNGSDAFIPSFYHSVDSSSTRDDDPVLHFNGKQDEDTNQPSVVQSSASGSGDRGEEDSDDDDSYSALQTDESMDATSPSQDTDEPAEMPPASTVASAGRKILCNLLWSNGRSRPFGKSEDPENQRDFVWSDVQPQAVGIWPPTHVLSKQSPVKVFP